MKGELNILVLNGVNLDLLGQREPEIYGKFNLADIEKMLEANVNDLAKISGHKKVNLTFFQTNSEEDFLLKLSEAHYDGLVMNPAAWTHTSLALGDRLAALGVQFVEVHISNIASREEFRKKSFSAPHSAGVVYGFGLNSYLAALYGLLLKLNSSK